MSAGIMTFVLIGPQGVVLLIVAGCFLFVYIKSQHHRCRVLYVQGKLIIIEQIGSTHIFQL